MAEREPSHQPLFDLSDKTIWSVGTRICFYQPNQGPCLCNLCVIRPIMFGNQSETVSEEEEMIYLVVMPNHRDG